MDLSCVFVFMPTESLQSILISKGMFLLIISGVGHLHLHLCGGECKSTLFFLSFLFYPQQNICVNVYFYFSWYGFSSKSLFMNLFLFF